jgi:hypothetical protein
MSENTPNEFEPTPSPTPDEEIQPGEANALQAEQPAEREEQAPSPESMLPPEAQGEANGGPLGCCLGIMVGMLLSLSLAVLSRVFAGQLGSLFQGNYGLLGLLVRILMGILAVALAIFFGYLGWKLGRKFYREYEPPPAKERKRRPGAKKVQQKV